MAIKRDALYSSRTDEWETPQALFDSLNWEFGFDLDPCADETNHKCERYFTKAENGLEKSWGGVQRVLQSALRQAHRGLGSQGIRGEPKTENARRMSPSRADGHKMVPRLRLRQG